MLDTFVFLNHAFAAEYLGRPNEMWPIIEAQASESHKIRISERDASAYVIPNSGPLENAVLFGYQGLVERFASTNDVLQKEGVGSFYLAASLGRIEAVKTLICKGVDVDVEYTNGLTPLYAAAEYGELEAFKLLINKGADINHRANVQFTILQLALAEKRKKMVEYLLDSEYIITDQDLKSLSTEKGTEGFNFDQQDA